MEKADYGSRLRTLVTGGTRGIGKATAQSLISQGHEVFVTGTSPEGKAPENSIYRACDFLDSESVIELGIWASEMEISVLVNNAGINKVGPLNEYDLEDFKRIQQVNVTAPFLLCRAMVPGMIKRRFGRIVNITSIYGVVSREGRAAYSTSKFGLFGLSRALALEVAPYNVLVNCLAPGFVDTELTREILGEEGILQVVSQVPLGRMAGSQEIGRYVAFLASEENSYMTGQNMVVDGGFTCG